MEEEIKNSLGNLVEFIAYEGAEIVIYTSNEEFFLNFFEKIKPLIDKLKRRIEVRMVPQKCKDKDFTINKIKGILPKECGIKDIVFEESRSIVYIEVEKPYLAIGEKGEIVKKIRNETFWTPIIERAPQIESLIVSNVKKFLHEEEKFRKNFLNEVGKRIIEVSKPKRNWIKITFLGGAREVGRSCLLVETNYSNILIDCGIKAGILNENGYPILKGVDISSLDAIVVSHAHLDHVGFVPLLYEIGFDGPIYMTEPTLELYTLLMTDFLEVMQKNMISIFSAKGVKESLKRAITLEYNEVTDITYDTKLTFYNAGHILGSGIVHLHIGEGLYNIVYALDQKFGPTTLLTPAYTDLKRVETLIIESTYGGKDDIMPKRKDAEKELIDTINEVMKNNGIVLIPSFAVERAQDIIAILSLNNFEYPVFIDGMIWDATSIYTVYPEYLNPKIKKILDSENIFKKDNFVRVTKNKRESIIEEKPSVIISTSGMMTGGPVIEYFKRICEDERNLLLFVGYQGENTLGRKIQDGLKEVQLEENGKLKTYKINIQVKTLKGLSGHSDRKQLVAYVNNLISKPKRIFVVHGEENKATNLSKLYDKIFGIETYAPRNLDSLRLI
jgi:KH/beta-lactamase-domain protein